jgi:L-fucose mutarotase/ribose pyranase (RbsD/FucU family)
MIIDSNLTATAHKRRQLPAPLLEHLIENCREGGDSVTIAILDQLAPHIELRRRSAHNDSAVRTLHMPSIPDAIRSICYLAPPANIEAPVLTMAPDPADHVVFPPQIIREQWRAEIDASCDGTSGHSWRGVPFGSISRVDGYRLAARSPFVIRTCSTEPYANLWLTVNPAASKALGKLPQSAPPQLISYLSQAGHGNGVAIVPAHFGHLFVGAAQTIQAEASVDEVAHAVASLWQPDTYAKHPEDPLQRGFGIHYPSPHPTTLPDLPNGWSNPAVQQQLTEEQMQQTLLHDLVGLIVLAHGGGSAVLLMTNGISGHDGGV